MNKLSVPFFHFFSKSSHEARMKLFKRLHYKPLPEPAMEPVSAEVQCRLKPTYTALDHVCVFRSQPGTESAFRCTLLSCDCGRTRLFGGDEKLPETGILFPLQATNLPTSEEVNPPYSTGNSCRL